MELVTLQAVEMNATDVHLVPKHDSAKVLFRLNGELRQMMVIPLSAHESMVARFKEEAGMDLSGNQRPQNGGFGLYYDEWQGDFRVASVGTTWGEMMVIHLLDRSNAPLSLDALGLDTPSLAARGTHCWSDPPACCWSPDQRVRERAVPSTRHWPS